MGAFVSKLSRTIEKEDIEKQEYLPLFPDYELGVHLTKKSFPPRVLEVQNQSFTFTLDVNVNGNPYNTQESDKM